MTMHADTQKSLSADAGSSPLWISSEGFFAQWISSAVHVTQSITLHPYTMRTHKCFKLGAGVAIQEDISRNRGLEAFLKAQQMHTRVPLSVCSFVFQGQGKDERKKELEDAIVLFQTYLPLSKNAIALELYIPQAHENEFFVEEVKELFNLASVLSLPLIFKTSILTSPDDAAAIMQIPQCSALAVTAGIPWTALPEHARKVFFRSQQSPLGGEKGMVTGKYLTALTVEWIGQVRRKNMHTSIIAGGGILTPHDVSLMREAGASAVLLDLLFRIRPWNIPAVCHMVYESFSSLPQNPLS